MEVTIPLSKSVCSALLTSNKGTYGGRLPSGKITGGFPDIPPIYQFLHMLGTWFFLTRRFLHIWDMRLHPTDRFLRKPDNYFESDRVAAGSQYLIPRLVVSPFHRFLRVMLEYPFYRLENHHSHRCPEIMMETKFLSVVVRSVRCSEEAVALVLRFH